MLSQTLALPESGNISILIAVSKKINYIDVTSKNLRRIREAHGLNQPVLATKIGSTPGRVSAYETGADAMGTDYIERVCNALGDVEFWEFFIDDETPIIKDAREKERIRLHRIEESLGIADQVREQEEIWIERAKRKGMHRDLDKELGGALKKLDQDPLAREAKQRKEEKKKKSA